MPNLVAWPAEIEIGNVSGRVESRNLNSVPKTFHFYGTESKSAALMS